MCLWSGDIFPRVSFFFPGPGLVAEELLGWLRAADLEELELVRQPFQKDLAEGDFDFGGSKAEGVSRRKSFWNLQGFESIVKEDLVGMVLQV